jgi:triacylglycerol lipase
MHHGDQVLLVHGLAETSAWMRAIELALALDGFRTHSMDYPSTRGTIEELTESYLSPAILKFSQATTLHIVGHSLGAVMVRYYLSGRRIPNLGRVVMIAPGNRGSRMITYLSRFRPYALVMGPAALQSTDDEGCFACALPPKLDDEFGVIAGCVSLDPLSWFVMQEPNDGRVTVESTKLAGMRDHIVLAASHDSLLLDPVAHIQTREFLRNGKFFRPGTSYY